MRVYIPSMGRADRLLNDRCMTHRYIKQTIFVVPQKEVRDYGKASNGFGVVGCDAKGIAETRQWIGEFALERGEKKFCMMDDDLEFYVRADVSRHNLICAKPADVEAMLSWIEHALRKHAHVSISPREGNNRAGVGNLDKLVVQNSRTLRVLAYRTKEFLAMKHGRVPVMEDFDINLQLLEHGYTNASNYWWAQGQRATGTSGGCSSYRTVEVHNAAAEKLARLHPEFVKLRMKENRSGPLAMRNRKEVTIFWKKAFAEARSILQVAAE